ncbi:hypothetical protein GDO86_000824 [Hymenochirus boettgeri]|uniref:Uncharacterized protein n=1 Tax=Hymenochirus boettgeri TaxID=247094 RepID=A0A8T2KIX5_9PIPI|nr:hypothetical protein GDO86_000824 [Hymenochirus boettgeri]
MLSFFLLFIFFLSLLSPSVLSSIIPSFSLFFFLSLSSLCQSLIFSFSCINFLSPYFYFSLPPSPISHPFFTLPYVALTVSSFPPPPVYL